MTTFAAIVTVLYSASVISLVAKPLSNNGTARQSEHVVMDLFYVDNLDNLNLRT